MLRFALCGVLLLAGCSGLSGAVSTADDLLEGLSDVCLAGLTGAVTAPIAALRDQVAALQGQLETPPPPPSCPDHWSGHGDSCYLIPLETSSWHTAHHSCAQLDSRARLASVHRSNIEYVTSMLSVTDQPFMWIGLVRTSSSPSAFGWVDGSPLDATNWVPGEPNNAFNSTEDCVHLYGLPHAVKLQLKWNDVGCSRSFHFLCRIKLTAL